MLNTMRIRAQLQQRVGVLLRRLEEVEETLREPQEDDLEERSGEWDDHTVSESLACLIREELALLRESLRRLEDGTYGRCEGCGRRIAERRLRAVPHARECVRCARRIAA